MVCMHTHTHTYIHIGILLGHKNKWSNAICSNMDGPRNFHTKRSKPGKCKYDMISWYGESKKKQKIQKDLFSKQKDSQA